MGQTRKTIPGNHRVPAIRRCNKGGVADGRAVPLIRSVSVLFAFFVSTAGAGGVETVTVKRKSGRIFVHSVVTIDAPREFVHETLLDYDALADISERFVYSSYVDPGEDGLPRVHTRLEGCIVFFCRTIERVATIESTAPASIVASVIPSLSNLAFGREIWQLDAEDGVTRLVYDLEMRPDFWVPPLVGPWAIRREMKKDATKVVGMIESLYLDAAQATP
jgi:hypothetical protein